MRERLQARHFDIHRILDELSFVGATSVKCLDDRYREALLEEAQSCSYVRGREAFGSGERIVRQELEMCEDIPHGSEFFNLRDVFQTLMDQLLAEVEPYPFESPLAFNELVLQRYAPGSIGITPHKDRLAYVNLICVFNLAGRGRFYVAADRSGREARPVDAEPGSVILMRAPGYRHARKRPFHAVDRIEEARYVCGLRQLSPNR